MASSLNQCLFYADAETLRSSYPITQTEQTPIRPFERKWSFMLTRREENFEHEWRRLRNGRSKKTFRIHTHLPTKGLKSVLASALQEKIRPTTVALTSFSEACLLISIARLLENLFTLNNDSESKQRTSKGKKAAMLEKQANMDSCSMHITARRILWVLVHLATLSNISAHRKVSQSNEIFFQDSLLVHQQRFNLLTLLLQHLAAWLYSN